MNLNEHGAACRCLLRLRENQGKPGISDAAFIQRFLPNFPEWQQRPGAVDVLAVGMIARELRLGGQLEVFRDYDRVLAEHRAGAGVLVCTERVPEQTEPALAVARYTMLIVEMNAEAFTVWCPYPSGQSDTLPKAKRAWWDRWLAIGLVLRP